MHLLRDKSPPGNAGSETKQVITQTGNAKMKNVFAAVVVLLFAQTAFAGEPVSFETAYQNAKATGRPMLVVLGAEWCPGCVVLKNQTIPEAQRRGGLRNVELTHIDIDVRKDIAAKLQRGPMIPQVVRMDWNGESWKVKRFNGVPNVESVQAFAKTRTKTPARAPQDTKLLASVQ